MSAPPGRGQPPAADAAAPVAWPAWAEDRMLRYRLLRLPGVHRDALITGLSDPQARELAHRWPLWAHNGQLRPEGDWRVWLIRAGRGFGKTRAGAEWVWEIARAIPEARIALVAASLGEAVRVMVEGKSGLIAVARPREYVRYRATSGLIELGDRGATAQLYSAAAPETLRGPEHHAAWCDELAKWRYGDAAWDNLILGLRLGERPRCVVTTTPRPNALMHKVMALRDGCETGGSTYANPHLPDAFVAAVEADFAGTRLGRQELHGELLADAEGALWTRAMLAACRTGAVEPALLVRVVVGVDPPASAAGDACGIVACGLDRDGTGWVIEDASVAGASPEGWARAVAACAARHDAERVVAEKNNGGEMVASVLLAAAAGLPVKLVHASRGKVARAEPVAALYERGLVRHALGLGPLEDELCGLVVGGEYAGPGRSPDRADACVWALTELMLGKRRARAAVRTV